MSEFTYCLNTSTIRPAPLLDKVRIAGQLGYRAIEPWNDEVDDYLNHGGTIDELNRAIADAGLRVVSMIALHGWITAEGEEYRRVLDDCRRRMEQAAALGSPFIVASPPHEVVDLGHAARRYAELLKLGREAGVKPAMEFLGFVAGIKDVRSALAIADGSGDRDATVVADVFHMMRGGGSIDDLLQIQGDRLAIFHINDLPASPPPAEQTDADRVLPGDGIADLPRVLANLRSIGYRDPLSLELFNPGLWARDPAEVARIGLERLRALVEGGTSRS
jgi:sugar phosphate isomerase/epimerase